MVEGDYLQLVKSRPVGQWRETLAVLATYSAPEAWASLCDALAGRLAGAGLHHAASLCYICAGNVDQAVAYWVRAGGAGGGAVDALQVRRRCGGSRWRWRWPCSLATARYGGGGRDLLLSVRMWRRRVPNADGAV
jgi:hypothetical protein